MTMRQSPWTRRHFLQTAGLAAAAPSAARLAQASLLSTKPPTKPPTWAYAAVEEASESGVQVFRSVADQWEPIQFIHSVSPSTVLLHPAGTHLFVANARNRFEGLPTASIECFSIDPRDGTLKLQQRQRLALASIRPSALAFSPEESLLVIAAAGGIFNMMPVGKDGGLSEVTAARKEILQFPCPVQAMRFTEDHQLMVQTQSRVSFYHCTRNGMNPTGDRPSLPTVAADWHSVPGFPTLRGLKSVAFA